MPERDVFREPRHVPCLRNDKARFAACSHIAWNRLSPAALVRLADHIRQRRTDYLNLARSAARSLLIHSPGPDWDTADVWVARMWVDEALDYEDRELWLLLAAGFLESGLGTSERMAAAARHWLDDEAAAGMACNVLAQAGKIEDVPLIWLHPKERVARQWQVEAEHEAGPVGLANGWVAIVRLAAP